MRRTLMTTAVLLTLPAGLALTGASVRGGLHLLADGTATGGDPADAIAGLASVLTAALAGWLTLVLLLAVLARIPGRLGSLAARLRDLITPRLVRRWATLVLGASVTASVLPGTAVAAVRAGEGTGGAAPAPGWSPAPRPITTPIDRPGPEGTTPTDLPGPGWDATPTTPTPTPTTTTRSAAPPITQAPGWTPRRPPPRPTADPGLLTGRQRDTSERDVVVRRGDSLWSIAAARLGPEATTQEIARAWPAWYSANAERIGDDPDLVLPGTLLRPPSHHHDPGTSPATKGTP